jgi:hypothetical protein
MRIPGPPDEAGETAPRRSLRADRPLCFIHIAKTGGTSLTDALARLYSPDRVFSDGGNLSIAYLESLGESLSGPVFLAGHAAQGVAAWLGGRADMITLLRRPEDQAVSNYLHVLSEPHNALHAAATRLSFQDYLRRHRHQVDYQARSLAVALGINPAQSDALRTSSHALTGFLEGLPFVGVMDRMETCAEILSHLLPGHEVISLGCMNASVCRGVSTRTLAMLRQDYLDLRADPDLAPIFAREARLYATAQRVLARLEAAVPSNRALRERAAPAGFISAARFHTAQGITRGPTVVAPLKGSARYVIHGPYQRLAPGHYRAAYHLRLETPVPATGGRLKLEAACNSDIRLRRRWLNAAECERPGPHVVHFTHADCADVLEFRIRARGFRGGRLVFEGVTISPSTAARAWPSRVWRALSLARRALRNALLGLRRALARPQTGVRISR